MFSAGKKALASFILMLASVLLLRIDGWFGLGLPIGLVLFVLYSFDYAAELDVTGAPTRFQRFARMLLFVPRVIFGLLAVSIGASIALWVLYNTFVKRLPEYSGGYLTFGIAPVLLLYGLAAVRSAFKTKGKPALSTSGSNGYWFTSDLFEIEPGEDHGINSGRYGRQLAAWLKARLEQRGYAVEPILDEDWGRCLVCSREPFLLWVGCGSVDMGPHGPADPRPVVWHCFPVAEIPFFKRIFNKAGAAPAFAKLDADLHAILAAQPGITLVEEPWRGSGVTHGP